MDFFRNTKFRPLEVLDPEIFTHGRHSSLLTNAHHKQGRGSPKNFKDKHLKLRLKFHTWAPITLGVVGLPSRNFTRRGGSRPGWSSGHSYYKGCSVQNLGRPKMSKIRRDFWQLSTLTANVSGMHRLVANLNSTWSTTFHPLLGEKNWVNFGPSTKKFIDAHVQPPNWTFFGRL